MKKWFFGLLFVVLVGWGCRAISDIVRPSVRIACIGTSITEGYTLPVEQTYPVLLQNLVTSPDKVLNFGVGGTCMLKKSDIPYWQAQKYQFALDWKPTILIVEFGANDSKAQNWQYKAEFKQDYLALIDSFKKLSSSPKIYLCTPPPAFASNTFGVQPGVIDNEIVPIVKEVAKETGSEIIDLHTLMQGQTGWFLDGLHPNAIGTIKISEEVNRVIAGK
ncbi:GDSL-type esterase/lipase family protein [Spirosoma pomorum]